MSTEYGPYRQMGTLAERMAHRYQVDKALELEPHLAHYMDEVEVNIASDAFNHVGFMEKISGQLQATFTATADPREREFLDAVIAALQTRIAREHA